MFIRRSQNLYQRPEQKILGKGIYQRLAAKLPGVFLGFLVVAFLVLMSLPSFAQESIPSSISSETIGIGPESQSPPEQGTQTTNNKPGNKGIIVWSMIFLCILIGGVGGYVLYLQRKSLQICREEKQLTIFFQNPAGLPAGTIRGVITILIVVFSFYLILLKALNLAAIPEVLSGILSIVLGFYFGNRTASKQDTAVSGELELTRQQRDEAVATKDEGKVNELLKKANKGLGLVKTVMNFLPADLKKKHEGVLAKLEGAVKLAENFAGKGSMSEAAEKAEKAFKIFKEENPLRDIVSKAVSSFGKVSGISTPPLAIISAVVGISATFVGIAYSKWKARILNTPFSPSIVPLKLVDADTGFLLFRQSPVLKQAFEQKITDFDRGFMESAVKDFLTQETSELWEKYKEYFESQEIFEKGLQQFRKAVANLELKTEVDLESLKEVGGYEPLMTTIDKIQENEEAKADLDILMEVTEGLQKSRESVKDVFDKTRKELEP